MRRKAICHREHRDMALRSSLAFTQYFVARLHSGFSEISMVNLFRIHSAFSAPSAVKCLSN